MARHKTSSRSESRSTKKSCSKCGSGSPDFSRSKRGHSSTNSKKSVAIVRSNSVKSSLDRRVEEPRQPPPAFLYKDKHADDSISTLVYSTTASHKHRGPYGGAPPPLASMDNDKDPHYEREGHRDRGVTPEEGCLAGLAAALAFCCCFPWCIPCICFI